MSDIYLDPATGDINLAGGSARLTVAGVEEVRQRLAARLNLQLGAWALDITAGVPWREQVLIRAPSLVAVRALIVAQIVSCPGVVGLESFDLALNNATRALSFTFRAIVALPGADVVEAAVDFEAGGQPDDAATLWLVLTPRGGIL